MAGEGEICTEGKVDIVDILRGEVWRKRQVGGGVVEGMSSSQLRRGGSADINSLQALTSSFCFVS